MTRLWPRTLVGQLLLTVSIALFAAQAIGFALLMRAQGEERRSIIAVASAAALIDAGERLAQGMAPERARDPHRRGRFHLHRDLQRVQRVRMSRRQILVAASPAIDPDMTAMPRVADRVAQMLADADLAVVAVRAGISPLLQRPARDGQPQRMVAVAAQLPDGRWVTARAGVTDAGMRVRGPVIGQTLLLFVLILVPTLIVARRVGRPLGTLTRAVQGMRPGRMADDVSEAGPEDVRALIRAFNDLSHRVRGMLGEKDRMLGAVGHDLRTPLASLRVRVEQVEDAALRDAMARTIAEMATMLDDILALARVGHAAEAVEAVDLAALLLDLVGDYQAMGRPVRLAAEGALVSAPVPVASLRRALRNLIDNAVTYGGAAEVGLDADAEAVRIWVADDGPGIPEARIAEMLEPFARAEQSRNRDTGGAGLGLALAKAIAEQAGGRLMLANRPSGGMLATISLPLGQQ